MTPTEFIRAAVEPVSRLTLLPALLLFWLLGAFGLLLFHVFTGTDSGVSLIGVIGLTLIWVAAVPALLRYLLSLIEERALRRAPPLPDSGMFSVLSTPRRLFALVPAGLLLFFYLSMAPAMPRAAGLIAAIVAFLLLPLHAVLLALTDSPLASVNPLGMWRLLRRLLPAWLWLLPLAIVAMLSWRWLMHIDASGYWLLLLGLYWLLAFANVCGVLAARLDVAAETDIPAALQDVERRGKPLGERQQQAVLNHAYALISRGNRDGGFAHLDAHAAAADEPLLARFAFFNAMLRWDLADVALYYAQSLLPALLDAGQHAMALKVTVQCLHRNERFRPHAGDLPRLLAIAEQQGHKDVLRALSR
jgi:hypothetical protein